jgi:hypothetical protein
MRLVYLAVVVLAASYAPLLVVGALDPTANPIGLGLLAVLGTAVAALVLGWAGLCALWRLCGFG